MDKKLIESLDAKLRRLEWLAQKLLPIAVNGMPIMEAREMLKLIEAGRAELGKQSGASDKSWESSSLRRVGRLCARWREDADAMSEIASEERDPETILALECYERERTLRDCANDMEREWAGTEPTDGSSATRETKL